MCDLGRYADNDTRVHECSALVHLLYEVVEHFLSHFEVRNHAVLQRRDNSDIAGSAAQHFLGFLAGGLRFTGVVESNG
jgi:hypothetical protein